MKRSMMLAAAMTLLPGAAAAQALSCAIPRDVPRPRADLPDEKQPVRRLPTGGYTLAISWSPGYCKSRGDRPAAQFQCGEGNRFGFVLHGLWPDGRGKDWPQYCRSTGLLSRQEVRRNLCATPSVQLLQHEWAKHGTCMPGYTPAKYFARSTAMFRRLRFPDMNALSRQPTLTAGALATAIAAENGMRADMMRITTDRQGWLDEVWLCHDLRFRPARCAAHQGGIAPGAMVKIWRGAGA